MHLHPPSRRPFRLFPIWESINDQFSNRKCTCILRFGDLFVHFLFENRPITDFHTLSELYTRLRRLKNFSKFSQSTSAIPLFLGAPPIITRGHIGRLWAARCPAGRPAAPPRKSGRKSAEKSLQKKKKKNHRNASTICTRAVPHSFSRRTGISPVQASRRNFPTAPPYSCSYLQKES